MTPVLTRLQKQLCNTLQDGLPVCRRPYAWIAESLHSDERAVLRSVRCLRNVRIIRRIGALINYEALGRTGTLVVAHIARKNLPQVVKAVNSLAGVSHNYLRDHHYNLWFTLQSDSQEKIKILLSELSKRFGVKFHSLPARRVFKLDVRFYAGRNGRLVGNDGDIPKDKVHKLTDDEKYIVSNLQRNLKRVAQPFNFLCRKGLKIDDVLQIIKNLIDRGVIRRIAAVVDHRRLGFTANALFAAKVEKGRIEQLGRKLACLDMVSHCYHRDSAKGWPYSLLAMMHSRNMRRLQQAVGEFTRTERIMLFELLPTVAELKKQPVRYQLC